MSELRYTADHEWIRLEADGTATVGITDFAQAELGDVVYVELPAIGRELTPGEDAAIVESVKAASDVKAPVSGVVVAKNDSLVDDPGKVNADPIGDGWFYRIQLSDAAELGGLLDEAGYKKLIAGG